MGIDFSPAVATNSSSQGDWIFAGQKGLSIQPLIHGGGSKAFARGTENAPPAASMARSSEVFGCDAGQPFAPVSRPQGPLAFRTAIPRVSYVQIHPGQQSPHPESRLPRLARETLQHALEKDIYVSTGSPARRTKKGLGSFAAMGIPVPNSRVFDPDQLSDSNTEAGHGPGSSIDRTSLPEIPALKTRIENF
jgi:cysteine sulfinate desulfinase/cysteine desulfurase-like protein